MDAVTTPTNHWVRLAPLRPALQPHVRVHRRPLRGEVQYLLQDLSTGRFFRLGADSYPCIQLMDGGLSVRDILARLRAEQGDEAPSRDALGTLVEQLLQADLLRLDRPLLNPGVDDPLSFWQQLRRNPFALRIPMFNPDSWLQRWLWLVRPMIGRTGFFLWSALLLLALSLTFLNWPALTASRLDEVIAAQNLVLLWLLYPLLKTLHELAHAFTIKALGGEVSEMGILLMFFIPIPYVNASAANAFPDKRQRMLVSAAGIMIDLALASVALLLWLQLEPGVLHALCFSVAAVAGLATLMVNGNPLMRFDGYYLLTDLVELPNLAQRATAYIGYLWQRYALGETRLTSPAGDRRERGWLLGYGVLALLYRAFLLGAITLWLASYSLLLGGLVALWLIVSLLLVPFCKGMLYLLLSPRLRARRGRAIGVSLFAVSLAYGALFVLPLPLVTQAEAVVWLPEQARVRAAADGFVVQVPVTAGAPVEPGNTLVETQDALLDAEASILAARIEELSLRHQAAVHANRMQAALLAEQLGVAEAEHSALQERRQGLTVTSAVEGRFYPLEASLKPGSYLHQGDTLGYLLGDGPVRLRAVVAQQQIGLVRSTLLNAEVRLLNQPGQTWQASVTRIQPMATDQLPSEALSRLMGGGSEIDPLDPEGRRLLETAYLVDLELAGAAATDYPGGQARVVFHHGQEPLGWQWYRILRQLFLKRLDF